jgi:hypothetical protein
MRWIPGRLLVPLLLAALACVAILAFQSNDVEAQDSPEIAGIIRDTDGKPIANAWVTDGNTYTFTDSRGTFVFDSGKVVPGSSLIVSSSGFQQERIVAPNNGDPVEITMTDSAVRGIYFNPMLSNTPEGVASFIQIAKTTEVNAVVIDVKEHVVYFDTDNEVFRDANMVLPILDLPWLINEFHKNGIYVIARIVVFKDSPVAEHYPQYAVLDSYTGGLWRDQNGAAWVNPLNREMWDANIRLAEEVISLGFDEVQYDYIRFLARATRGRNRGIPERESRSHHPVGWQAIGRCFRLHRRHRPRPRHRPEFRQPGRHRGLHQPDDLPLALARRITVRRARPPERLPLPHRFGQHECRHEPAGW